MSWETLKRHHSILKAMFNERAGESIDNLQYKLYTYKSDTVLYIEGSNEKRDWRYNLMYFGIFFHLGYVILAMRLRGKLNPYTNIILVGHSLGAGVASVLYWLLGKRCKEAILFGCPPSYTWINPLVPKRMTSYRVRGDLVTHANFVRPLFRQAVIPYNLPKQSDNVAVNHSPVSYLDAIEEIIF
jgi:pimeloyl-ACP methyl ester carboxylesterase